MDNCSKTLLKSVSVDSVSQLPGALDKIVAPLQVLKEEASKLRRFEKFEVPKKK
jgi:hypothetical protein